MALVFWPRPQGFGQREHRSGDRDRSSPFVRGIGQGAASFVLSLTEGIIGMSIGQTRNNIRRTSRDRFAVLIHERVPSL